ncbi:hypothetical protein GQF04_26245 [Paenibacillus aceris]|nr:hypothetical protein [Paenibacillus aceris]NHW38012.1 hypothetical protein [Paenibacillus aceris]
MKLDDYQEIIIDQMKSNDTITDFKVTSEEDLTVNGFAAKQTEIHSVINKSINAAYQITFIETKDRFYQVIFWTTAKQMISSRGDLSKIVSSFREMK